MSRYKVDLSCTDGYIGKGVLIDATLTCVGGWVGGWMGGWVGVIVGVSMSMGVGVGVGIGVGAGAGVRVGVRMGVRKTESVRVCVWCVCVHESGHMSCGFNSRMRVCVCV